MLGGFAQVHGVVFTVSTSFTAFHPTPFHYFFFKFVSNVVAGVGKTGTDARVAFTTDTDEYQRNFHTG